MARNCDRACLCRSVPEFPRAKRSRSGPRRGAPRVPGSCLEPRTTLPRLAAAPCRSVAEMLAPGGVVCFRDYAMYDMAMLRFHGAQKLGDKLYRRGDGTLAYFFAEEEVRGLLAEAGLEAEEVEYHRVNTVNRKKGVTLRRVFVHAVARKPGQDAG